MTEVTFPRLRERSWFEDICRNNNFTISESSLKQLEQFATAALEWNLRINLVSRQDVDSFWEHHILGSTAFLFHRKLRLGTVVTDVGTGGGLPGIPLAILYPENEFILVDSIKKKINVVSAIVDNLELKNVRAVVGRIEEIARRSEFNHRCDYVIARAVASARDLLDWTVPLLKPRQNETRLDYGNISSSEIPPSSVVMLKGGDLTKEIHDMQQSCKHCVVAVQSIDVAGPMPPDAFVDKKLVIVQP